MQPLTSLTQVVGYKTDPTSGVRTAITAANSGFADLADANRNFNYSVYGNTLKDTPASTGIVGSNDPLLGKQTGTAINNAGNAITGPRTPTNTNPPDGSYYKDGKLVKPGDTGYVAPGGKTDAYGNAISEAISGNADAVTAAKNMAERTLAATQLQYNADLASTNLKYGSLFNDLKSKYNISLEVAQQNAIALNPYSTSRGATVATNFKQKITDNFNSAATQLQAQADIAQQQLAAGNYKAYVEIQNSLDKVISDVTQKNNQIMLDFTKQVEQSRQYEQSFSANQTNIAADNFRGLLAQDLPDTKTISSMIKDGSIEQDPLYKEALKAGYSPQGALSYIMSASKAQEDKSGLEWSKFKLQLDKEERMENNLNNTNRALATITAVTNQRNILESRGITYTDRAYTIGSALATGAGTIPSPALQKEYEQTSISIQAISNLNSQVQSTIKDNGGGSAILGRFNAFIGNPTAENTQVIKGLVQPLYSLVGKGIFGESGNLSDNDIKRIAAGFADYSKTSDVNTSLTRSIASLIENKINDKININAGSGVNLTGLMPTINNMYSTLDGVITSNTSSSPSQSNTDVFDSWWNSNYNNASSSNSYYSNPYLKK